MRHPLAVPAVALLVAACSGEAGPIQTPARQGLSLPERIEFPPTIGGSTSRAEGRVRNDGPEPIELHIEASWPFGPVVRRFVLRPGEERALRFTYRANRNSEVGYALVHAGGETQKLLLVGAFLQGCSDPCHFRPEPDGPCEPAPDGTACGAATECSDGATCRAGACLPAPTRDGAACQTECGADGTCADALCFSPAPEEEPAWIREVPRYSFVRHVDAHGTLVDEREGELILVDDRGGEAWRIADPLRRHFHPPAQDGLLLFQDEEGFGALDLRTGDERWRIDRRHLESVAWLSPTMAVLHSDGRDDAGTPTAILRAIDRRDGTERWSRELLRRAASALGRSPGWSRIAVNGAGDRLWASVSMTWSGGPEDKSAHQWVLFALDPANGTEVWARRGLGQVQKIFLAGDGAFLAAWHHYRKGEVLSLDAEGRVRWSVETGTFDYQGQVADAPQLLAGDSLFLATGAALDRATGSPRPAAPLAIWTVAKPVGSTMFGADQPPRALSPYGIVGFDPVSGEQRFWLPFQTHAFRSVADGEELLVEVARGRERAQVDSLLCRFDGHGRLLEERRLPMQAGARTAAAPHPPERLWFRRFEDRIEAWPLD